MKLQFIDTGPSRVGWHRHGLVLLCPQKYSHTYLTVEAIEARKTLTGSGGGARTLGSAVHAGLAHHYALMTGNKQYHDLASPARAIDASGEGFPDETRHAHAIFSSYVQVWHPEVEREQFRVLAVELEIEVEIDDEPYTQRVDLVTQDRKTGKVWFWDHKTTGSGLAYAAEGYTLSGQILGLNYLGDRESQRLFGAPFGGVTLNMIGKKPIGGLKDRFLRTQPQPAPGSLSQFENTIRFARSRIKDLAHLDPYSYPRVLDPLVCGAYGGCDFKSSCRWR